MTWNIGSVVEEVSKNVNNIPVSLSGTGMNNIVIGKINKVNENGGFSIGSTGIEVRFHDALFFLTAAQVALAKAGNAGVGGTLKLGEFSTKLGADSNSNVEAKNYADSAKEELKNIGCKVSSYQTFFG